MMRKFRKIFRPTTITTAHKNENIPTSSSPALTSDHASYNKQISSTIDNQLFTGRQRHFLRASFSYFTLSRLPIKDRFLCM